MLIRMSRDAKVAADGFTVVGLRKNGVYQVPDAIGRGLLTDKAATPADPNTLKDGLPRSHILAGRPERAGTAAPGAA